MFTTLRALAAFTASGIIGFTTINQHAWLIVEPCDQYMGRPIANMRPGEEARTCVWCVCVCVVVVVVWGRCC